MFTKSKTFFLLLVPLLGLLQPVALHAQDGSGAAPIHVTETLHNDGTRTVMKTDPDSRTAEATVYDQANKLRERTVFTLDDQGQAISGLVYSAKNVVLYKLIYKRDSMNRVNEVDAYSTKGVLLSRSVYHLDPQGRVLGVDTYDGNGNLIKNATPPGGTPPGKRGSVRTH